MPSPHRIVGLALAVLALFNVACSSDDETSPPDQTPTGMPDKEQLASGWNVMEPGGDTICARGGEFVFFARPGTVNKLVIEFQGGGACWSAGTCAEGSDMFTATTDRNEMSGVLEGIHDYANSANPFRDWYHVFVPYCTGDLNLGDATTSYGEFSIEHRGAVNGGAALDWVYANFPSPERVVVTGFSAGGYASIAWAPYIMQHYDGVPVVQLSDCAAGVAPPGFLLIIDGVWNASLLTPSFVPGLENPDLINLALPDIYQADAAYFANQQFAQYNTQFDHTQRSYYEDMAGDPAEWSQIMNDGLDAINAAAANFASYVAAGSEHTIIDANEVYTLETSGVSFLDWMTNLSEGSSVDDVHCEPDCGTPD